MEIHGLTIDDFETKVGKDQIELKSLLDKPANAIVTEFVATKEFKFDQQGNNNRIQCGYPGCPKFFATDERCQQKQKATIVYRGSFRRRKEKEDERIRCYCIRQEWATNVRA